MTVIDTSALMAVLLEEPAADAVSRALADAESLSISASTVAEALIVARRRGVGRQMEDLLDGLGAEVIPVSRAFAANVADAYDRWGKGVHPEGLNFGDCFAYALATVRAEPLLYVGEDFARTDVLSALAKPQERR